MEYTFHINIVMHSFLLLPYVFKAVERHKGLPSLIQSHKFPSAFCEDQTRDSNLMPRLKLQSITSLISSKNIYCSLALQHS